MNGVRIACATLCFLFSPGFLYGDSDRYVTQKNCPAAMSEADLDLFQDSKENNRLGLWVKLRQQGRAWYAKPGLSVTIVESRPPDKVKIRVVESTDTFWTFKSALDKQ